MRDKFFINKVYNRSIEKALEYSDLIGDAPTTSDWKELIDDDNIDALYVALPFHFNRQVVEYALLKSKHVIVEKPLTSTLRDAFKMCELEKEYTNCVTLVAEILRYRNIFQRAQELIKTDAIVNPYSLIWNNLFFVDPESNKYAKTAWRMEEQYPGGFIVDAGVHNIAVIRDMFGDFNTCTATLCGATPSLGKYDTFSLQFILENGMSGSLNLYFSAKGYRTNELYIFADKGTMIIGRDEITVKTENEGDLYEKHEDDMGYRAQFENFYSAITANETVKNPFSEGYKDLEVILGAVLTAEKKTVM